MASEWRVSSNIVNGVKMYAVYRLRNSGGVDHEGNREYYPCEIIENRGAAVMLADSLNRAVEE